MGKTLEYSVLRKKFGPKRDELRGGGEGYIMKSFVICIHQILLGCSKSRRIRWTGHVARMGNRRGAHRSLW